LAPSIIIIIIIIGTPN